MQNVHILLPLLALIFGVAGIIKPTWPLVAVGLILLAINDLIK